MGHPSRFSDWTSPPRYQALGLRAFRRQPEWQRLNADLREAITVVSQVLPFRANRYILDHLIDWSRVPDDPLFQLVFPHRDMLSAPDFDAVRAALRTEDEPALKATVARIRRTLNPHPAGQLTHNVPTLNGRRLPGLQHKYRETVVFFPSQGQTCHAYCTYCFRWAQFVGMDGLRFESTGTADLVAYLKAHPEVTDVLITGGDPMIMSTALLRRYIQPLLAPDLDHVQTIRIGTKSVASWPHRFVTDEDADDGLRLFETVSAAGRHLAIMGHYSHPIELEPAMARAAIRRIRDTGAQIRMQGPLVRHVNDTPGAWSDLWRTGVRLGLIPYYMFVERDTGPRRYFALPLLRALEIFQEAHATVSGLARPVQGPSMSVVHGKIRILGVIHRRDILGPAPSLPDGADPDEAAFICDFVQARDVRLAQTMFFAALDPAATWLDDLRPAFGLAQFPFHTDQP